MNKKQILSGVTFFILFVIGGFLYFKYDLNQSSKELQRIYSKYPPVLVETELLTIVYDIYSPVGYRDAPSLSFLQLKDIGNYRVDATSYTTSGRIGIDNEVCIGDSIIKKAGSDTILLKHKYEGYQVSHLFLLRKKTNLP